MRKLVLGPVHGGYKALSEVLIRSKYNKNKDFLICLGNYCDGWSHSAKVIDYFIYLHNNAKIAPMFLRGNHDVWLQNWLNDGVRSKEWIRRGGASTIQSYILSGKNMSLHHKVFMNVLSDFYVGKKNVCYVHGGYKSKEGIGNEPISGIYHWDNTLWELAIRNHLKRGINRHLKHRKIFVGHTPTLNYHSTTFIEGTIGETIKRPIQRSNVWNINTGAGWGGSLSIMDIDTLQYWQSKPLSEHYPNEIGLGKFKSTTQ
jgi:serine/threonine protein phosphatase 1